MKITEEFVFFWGGEFSQWHPSPFKLEGLAFSCAEQYMMYCKARLFGDATIASQLLSSTSPREQKALGRKVTGFDESTWSLFREGIVFAGNVAKYSQSVELREKLLASGNRTIVEASPKDTIWGVGLGEDDPRILDPSQWRGKNLLGETLMKVRSCLRDQLV